MKRRFASRWGQGERARGVSRWGSWLVVIVCLVVQIGIFTFTDGLGRTLLLGLSVLVEYGWLWWQEQTAALRDV